HAAPEELVARGSVAADAVLLDDDARLEGSRSRALELDAPARRPRAEERDPGPQDHGVPLEHEPVDERKEGACELSPAAQPHVEALALLELCDARERLARERDRGRPLLCRLATTRRAR